MSDPTIHPGDIIGYRADPQPLSEVDHFYVCRACGQAVDMRDLGAVLHHEDDGHAPLVVS